MASCQFNNSYKNYRNKNVLYTFHEVCQPRNLSYSQKKCLLFSFLYNLCNLFRAGASYSVACPCRPPQVGASYAVACPCHHMQAPLHAGFTKCRRHRQAPQAGASYAVACPGHHRQAPPQAGSTTGRRHHMQAPPHMQVPATPLHVQVHIHMAGDVFKCKYLSTSVCKK